MLRICPIGPPPSWFALCRNYILWWTRGRRHRRVNNRDYECLVEHHGTSAMTQPLAQRRGNPGIRRSPEDGYTLIELLIVWTIISLIVGVVGPHFLSYLGV